MPANKGVTAALDLIAKEPSKVLGLTIGGHKIEKPGQFVPKAGTSFSLVHRSIHCLLARRCQSLYRGHSYNNPRNEKCLHKQTPRCPP